MALLVIAGLSLKRRPWIGFGLLWFFLHLLPTNSIIPRLDVANERHLYIAGWGIFLLVSAGLGLLRENKALNPNLLGAAAVCGLLVFGIFTLKRISVYETETALWEDSVKKNPCNARAHNNLGFAHYREGRHEDSLTEYELALQLRPGYELARKNLSAARASLSRRETP